MTIIQTAGQVSQTYDSLLARARHELLVFNRPPYAVAADWINPVVLEALGRGVKARVLYQRAQWEDPAGAAFRAAMAVYHQAGVEGRLVDELPLKLAIVDREAVLLAMPDPAHPDLDQATTVYIEHRGHATFQADAFEQWWGRGDPIADDAAEAEPTRTDGDRTSEPAP